MGVCVIGGVLSKPQSDMKLFTIDWSELLRVPIQSGIAISDKIKASSWQLDTGSPTSTIAINAHGFDEASGTAWVTLSGGGIDDVAWVNNTIDTTGACVNGKNTPAQRLVRQIRVRVQDC